MQREIRVGEDLVFSQAKHGLHTKNLNEQDQLRVVNTIRQLIGTPRLASLTGGAFAMA